MTETANQGVLRSEQINELAGALAKAQGEMAVPEKKRTATVRMRDEKGGGTYTYKYADLSDIRQAIVPALAKHGLAVTQVIDATTARLTTLLLHSSGQFIGSTYDLPRGLAAQQFGSALTYAKRYSLCSITGVVAEEDDDAQVAQPAMQRANKAAKSGPVVKPIVGPSPTGGTSRPNLPAVPKNLTRDDIMRGLTQMFPAFSKLRPQLDISGFIFERYGAKTRNELSDEEAYDFSAWMETELRNGVAQ